MNAKQQREWEDDVTQPCAFPEPLAEVLTRENRELRAEVSKWQAIASITHEGPATYVGTPGWNLWATAEENRVIAERASERAERAEAELADATTAAQNLRDELQGAQERLRAIARLADRGVGTDITPTVSGREDVGWWYDYLRQHDNRWRGRLAALADPLEH